MVVLSKPCQRLGKYLMANNAYIILKDIHQNM